MYGIKTTVAFIKNKYLVLICLHKQVSEPSIIPNSHIKVLNLTAFLLHSFGSLIILAIRKGIAIGYLSFFHVNNFVHRIFTSRGSFLVDLSSEMLNFLKI